jgi:hypothetical protein
MNASLIDSVSDPKEPPEANHIGPVLHYRATLTAST